MADPGEHGRIPNRVFFCSIPKSGTYLVLQALSAVPRIGPRLHPALFGDDLNVDFSATPDSFMAQRDRLASVAPGGVAFGHVFHTPERAALVAELGFAVVFLYRDPRDQVVSLMHYATRMEPDMVGLEHLPKCLHTDRDRLLALITGFAHGSSRYPGVATYYRGYLGWRNAPGVLALRFEDLVESPERRRIALERLYLHIAVDPAPQDLAGAIAGMEAAIVPASSPTFRRGKTGSWREEFDPLTVAVFEAVAGEVVAEFGYETDGIAARHARLAAKLVAAEAECAVARFELENARAAPAASVVPASPTTPAIPATDTPPRQMVAASKRDWDLHPVERVRLAAMRLRYGSLAQGSASGIRTPAEPSDSRPAARDAPHATDDPVLETSGAAEGSVPDAPPATAGTDLGAAQAADLGDLAAARARADALSVLAAAFERERDLAMDCLATRPVDRANGS